MEDAVRPDKLAPPNPKAFSTLHQIDDMGAVEGLALDPPNVKPVLWSTPGAPLPESPAI
jgi:hypothetical protein